MGRTSARLGLADLFVASFEGTIDTNVQNSYLNIEKPHALTEGLENAARIINGANWMHVRATEPLAGNPLTLVPPYPNLPMEEVYARDPHTDPPGAYLRTPGKGRVVYFPFDIDSHLLGGAECGFWLGDAPSVEWARGGTSRSPQRAKG